MCEQHAAVVESGGRQSSGRGRNVNATKLGVKKVTVKSNVVVMGGAVHVNEA